MVVIIRESICVFTFVRQILSMGGTPFSGLFRQQRGLASPDWTKEIPALRGGEGRAGSRDRKAYAEAFGAEAGEGALEEVVAVPLHGTTKLPQPSALWSQNITVAYGNGLSALLDEKQNLNSMYGSVDLPELTACLISPDFSLISWILIS